MKIAVREMESSDIEKVVDYFINSDVSFLESMGANKKKLPKKKEWVKSLRLEYSKTYSKKQNYYIIWVVNNKPIGHSNVNSIKYGESAKMHLHIWDKDIRKNGFGLKLLKLTIPFYFKNLKLKKLICEPYSKNIAPNKTLKKLGFDFIKTYETIPGQINFKQLVNQYELTSQKTIQNFD